MQRLKFPCFWSDSHISGGLSGSVRLCVVAHLDAEVDALIKVQALECLKYF